MAKAPAEPKKTGRPRGSEPGIRKLLNGTRLSNGLMPQQEAYCRARAMGMSIPEAMSASAVTSSKHTVYKWEADPKVRSRIDELSALATKNAILKNGLDRDWVISRLMQNVERCMQAEPVLDKEGNETGEWKYDSTGANTALRMLGDTMGLFKPADKKQGEEYAELTDDDIARIAQELAAQTGLLEVAQGTQAQAGPEQVIEVQAVPKAG